MKRLAVIGALAALAAAGSGVGTSAATFTAHDAFTGTVERGDRLGRSGR